MAKYYIPTMTEDGEIINIPADDIHIAELKQKLADTDYVCNKIIELFATETNILNIFSKAKEFKEIILQRQEWRNEINELEVEE